VREGDDKSSAEGGRCQSQRHDDRTGSVKRILPRGGRRTTGIITSRKKKTSDVYQDEGKKGNGKRRSNPASSRLVTEGRREIFFCEYKRKTGSVSRLKKEKGALP